MSIATVAEFVDALRTFHLLSQVQFEKLSKVLGQFSTPHSLARKLIDGSYLTAYQINQLFGHGKNAELLLGPYVILEKLGEGGMGQVFKARNWKMNRLVALKVIRKERLDKPENVQRFYREVRAAAQVSHPNVVLAFDADEVSGTHFFAMEFVDGPNLAKLVKERGPLPIEHACEYVRQAACGLQHAHEKGLVHRDIKPSNILVSCRVVSGGVVSGWSSKNTTYNSPLDNSPLTTHQIKILDMGLARVGHGNADSVSDLTQEGAVMGTPDYIAPEQMLDAHNVDIRADLYSLGCTFYYLLTGSVPFPGGSMGEKLLKHQMHYPTPVEQLRPDTPAVVVEIVNRLMAKRCEDRFQTPAEVASGLENLRAEVLVSAAAAEAPIQPANDPNVLADWAAIAAASLGPSSRPGLGNSPPAPPSVPSNASEDTMAGRSSVVDARSRGVIPAAEPVSTGGKGILVFGVGIGAAVGLLLVGIVLLFVLPGKSSDTRSTARQPGQSTRTADEPRLPVFLVALPESDIKSLDKGFSKNGLTHLGQKIAIKGAGPQSALYMHPTDKGNAQAVYRLDKKYKEFHATVALADSAAPSSATPVTFVVSADGWVLWKSAPVQKPGEVQACVAPVGDRTLLKLEVLCPGSHSNAHAVWIEPQLK